jgi:putative transposase
MESVYGNPREMLRTASILLNTTAEQFQALGALRAAYAEACNRLAQFVVQHRCWNRVALHNLAYSCLRSETALGSQMACNSIFSVCKAYKAQSSLGRIESDRPVPTIRFDRASVHYDKRTYTLKGAAISLYTLTGRIMVATRIGNHQRRLLEAGTPKEAELILRKGRWFFNLVIETDDPCPVASGLVMGIDVGENTLAAISTGRIFGGENLRHRRDCYLALRRRLQSNGSQSARQKLRQVSGSERRRVMHVNHETSRTIVVEALRQGVALIAMEDLTHIRQHIEAGRRTRARLHRWTFRQLQNFIEYKARAVGIEVVYLNPAYTSRTCASCGGLGRRIRYRFLCDECGLRAHADLNASRNLAWIGGTTVPRRAAVNTPNVGNVACSGHVLQ